MAFLWLTYGFNLYQTLAMGHLWLIYDSVLVLICYFEQRISIYKTAYFGPVDLIDDIAKKIRSGKLSASGYDTALTDEDIESRILTRREEFRKDLAACAEAMAPPIVQELPADTAATGVRGVAVDMGAAAPAVEGGSDDDAVVRYNRAQQHAAAFSAFQLVEAQKNAVIIASKNTSEAAAAAALARKNMLEADKAEIEKRAAEEKIAFDKKAAEEKNAFEMKAAEGNDELEKEERRERIKKAAAEARRADAHAKLIEAQLQETNDKKRKHDTDAALAPLLSEKAERLREKHIHAEQLLEKNTKEIVALEEVIGKAASREDVEAQLKRLTALYVIVGDITRSSARRKAVRVWENAHKQPSASAGINVEDADENVLVFATAASGVDCKVAIGSLGDASGDVAQAMGYPYRRALQSKHDSHTDRETLEVMSWVRLLGPANVIYSVRIFGDSLRDIPETRYKRAVQACCERWGLCFGCANKGHFIVNQTKTRHCALPPYTDYFKGFGN